MSSDEDDDFCFGQREPPLVEYVKQILRNYTEGQLLKELTQNADDAGATTVRFLYDGREHGTNKLYCGEGIGDLSPYQGPALCSFNDATFLDKDWTSIQNLSRSEKKDDPTKVGRFGMGFVSVYHVTDVPSIVSGNYLAFMDPTETLFTYKRKARRGRQLDMRKRASIFKDPKFSDQFRPYKDLFSDQPGLFEGHSFTGAMFRFPLRRRPSLVSENVIDGDDVKRLFKLFVDDAKILLLFLKTINSITVGEKLTKAEVPLFSANISDRTKDVVQKSRKAMVTAIRRSKPLHSNEYTSFSTIFPMHIEIVENFSTPEEYKWLISIYLEGSDNPSKLLTLAKKLDRLPLVGVAMRAFSVDNCVGASSPLEGRTCCFLPLPPSENYSGLPVHANADFGISDDRRTIKWPVEDRNDKMSKWNTLLLQQLFPIAYTRLILHAIEQYSTGEVSVDCVYKTWPDVNKVRFPWKELMCPNFFKILLKKDVFFSEIGGGKWINIDEAIFANLEDIPKGTQQLIVRLLLENNVPIVSTRNYPHVMDAVVLHSEHTINSVTPSRVRDTLRNVSLCSLARNEKICLLTYLLADDDFDDLHGFELLPLADSSFCRFASKTLTDDEVIYFSVLHECSMDLLPGLRSRFLDENIEESLKDKIICGSQMTGINQVQELKPNMIATLIRDALPSDWSKSAEVMWYPGHPNHPPRCWLKKFWNFLQELSKNDISKYEGITLIPRRFSEDQTEVKLIQLVRNSNIVVIDDHQDSQVEARLVEAILPSLHLIPVNLENAEFVKFFRHDIWKTYLHSLEPNDILRIFADAGTGESLQNDVKRLSAEDVQVFRRFLGNIRSLKDDIQRNVLLRIPVFEEATRVLGYNCSSFQSAVINDKELRVVNKGELPDFPTEEIFLDISDTDSNILASKLGLETCPREEVLCQMVRCSSNEDGSVTSLIIWIMDRWDEFQPSKRKIIIDTIKKEPFVPLPDGSHRKASECFDPSDELLAQLFNECLDIFPSLPFGIKYRSILLQLGLKTRSKLTKHEVQRCAEDVTSNSNVKKGKALLKLLNENSNFLTYSTLLDYLLNNRWVPVEDEIDKQIYPSELPRFCECECLLKPNEATSVSLAPLVGSTMPLVSNEYTKLSSRFNWEAHPQSDKIYNHLQNIVDFVSSCQKNIDNQLDIPGLEKTLHSIYKFMQNNIDDFTQFKECDDKWVWTGTCFVAPSRISLKKTRHSLEPYSFVLQPRFSKYKHLFRAFGATEKVDEKIESMLELLEEIKEFHETPGNTDITSDRIEHDLDLAIYVIEGIIDLNKGNVTDEIRDKIFLPVQNSDYLQFASCNDVCYPNEDWLEFDKFDDINIVHEKVSRKIYNCLDVIPLGQKISGAMSLLGFQQAGQKEDLTQKLRNILDSGYTEDSIANEMIQNADDASASEVKFMIDMRTNNSSKTRLLDKGMKSWQGPALWVYNDSTFSDADFENITKIGGRTKGSNPELIGKFGLGFNSVYHITDVPSFLSRGLVGFLDPHTNFLDSQLRDKRNPGIRIDLNQSKLTLKRFRDQFQPFHGIFGCNLFDSNKVQFDGALFRLPLRTTAIKSQISDKHFEEDDVLHLMENVYKNAEKLLLFTQHVTKVSVYYLGNHSEPQHASLLFSATKSPKEYIKEINNSIKYLGDMEKFKMQNCILLESSKFLSSCLELKNTGQFPSSLTRICVEHCLTKEGALYYRNASAKCTSTEWLVCSCMGQSNSLELYKSDTTGFKIPCGGIALPLLSQPIQGEVFCFLPLSIPTSGIACHINGNFEVSNDRRNLWRRGTITSVRDLKSDWNDAIFTDIISRSYVSLLSHKQAQCCLTAYSTYDLWPNESQIPMKSEYLPLLKAFYRAIVYGTDDSGDKPCVFKKDDKWLNIDAIFIYKPYTQTITDDVKNILQRFISSGMYVVDIPDKVIKGFERAGCGDAIQKRIYTEERFFEEVFFPNINYVESEMRDKLTMHVIDNYKRSSYRNLLKQTACIPTGSASEPLKRISDLVHPYGKVSDLFEPEEHRFPNTNYQCDETRLEVLVKLGMLKDDLSLSELLERARALEGFKRKRKRKMNKIQCFMKFLETKSGLINQKFMNDIQCIKIIPVSKKPVNFPADFPWYGDECDDFLCAAELHPFAYSNLVCFVKPVVNEQAFRWCRDAENVSRIFNLSKQMRTPSCLEVAQQLKKLSNIPNKYLLANEAMVLKMCNIIYSVLEREVDCNKELSDELQTDDWAWVWHGDGFTCTSSVCINKGTVNLKPYFYSVHQSLRCYNKLFIHCKVPQEQSERLSDLIGILHKIKNKHDSDNSPLATDIERDRNLVIEILTFIKGHSKEDMKEHGQDILIPIECKEELRLVRPEECCFCDDWFKCSLTSDHDENLVHQDVTNAIAAFFGVPPLSRKLSHSYEIGITHFGQEEPLTQRLHNILEDYQDVDIPKEMIQNADDAKATEVKFLIDLSKNSNTNGLLDIGMSLCHGPALCVFNNAMFTEDDFENITKLGGQTKRQEKEKIGKFGLGFNSVYHLTDVPSFISNGRLTIFDPHRFHLGNQIRFGAPGIQINFSNNPKILDRFHNQFRPYENIFGCDLRRNSFTGTLFRLPLRTDEQVQKGGKISSDTFSKTKIRDLIKRFLKQAGEMLIFTKHVQRMSIYRRNNYDEHPTCICSVTKKIITEKRCGKTCKITINVQYPNGGCQYFQLKGKQEHWLIHTVNGTNESSQIARSTEGVKHGLSTCGGLAYKYHSTETVSGIVFCFLPLSIPPSGLPIHINAKFSVTPDRRSLRKKGSGDDTTIHSEWNNALMKDVIARAYITLLSEPTPRTMLLTDVSTIRKKDGLFSLWPRTDCVHTDILHVVHSFYQAVVHGLNPEAKSNLPRIFNVDQNWLTFDEINFFDADLKDCQIVTFVTDIMVRQGFVIVELPDYILKSFVDSHCFDELMTRTVSFQQFFEVYFFPKISELPDDDVNVTLLYLLQHNDFDWVDDMLKSTPCIPSTPDGVRKIPSELIDHTCHLIASMYLPNDGKFALGNEFRTPEILVKLRSLGMAHLSIPLDHVVERCQSIELRHQISDSHESTKICRERANAILKYIDSIKTDDKSVKQRLLELQNIKFIPTETESPKHYPVLWANTKDVFLSPKCVYSSDLKEYVGAVAPLARDLKCTIFTKKIIRIKITPDLTDVIKQLKQLISTDCTNVSRIHCMYMLLITDIQKHIKTKKVAIIKESLQNLPVVFCAGKFVKIEQVALTCNREFQPYLYKLPTELKTFVDFFKILGLEENFHPSTLLNVSYLLQSRYKEKALGDKDMQVAVDLVLTLAACKDCSDDRQILIPDSQMRLRPVSELSFCLHDSSVDNIKGETLCHNLIPHEVADKLGVKDIRLNILSKNRHKLKYGTKFGQVQKLTSRIREILEGYPCDDSIFKELLQNADDAGADEINFIYDPRQHPNEKVFCESWKQTLGPALCVYNNRPFTESDLKGIQDLGIGSKSTHPDKTGQYGIGFNSVYHLTDCPTFLSNDDTLCIFDPRCAYIDDATADAPGSRYDISQELNNLFSDALSCFRLDSLPNTGCTMFRFPLRTTKMSYHAKDQDSVMSRQLFDGKKLPYLLDTFKNNAFDMLLYLNNLKKITVSHIDEISHRMETEYVVEAELSQEDEEKRRKFYSYVKECAHKSKLEDIKVKEVMYELKISDSRGQTEAWLVNQRIGSSENIPLKLSSAYKEGDLKLLPRGGVAACLSGSQKLCCAYCFLPLPIFPKLPVSVNGHFSLDSTRRNLSNTSQNSDWNLYIMSKVISCSYSQLLRHLRDRKFGLVSGCESPITCTSSCLHDMMELYWNYFPNLSDVHTEWKDLAEHVFLNVINNQMPLFPVVRRTDDVIAYDLDDCTDNEYRIEWLPAVGAAGRKVYFDTETRTSTFQLQMLANWLGDRERKKMLLKAILQHIVFTITSAPKHIYEDLTTAGKTLSKSIQNELQPNEAVKCHEIELVTPNTVVYFLKTGFNPGTLPCNISMSRLKSELNYLALLEYVDKDKLLKDGKIPLDDLPLLLTQDSWLRKFNSTDTYFCSRKYALLPKCWHEFVHESAQSHFSDNSLQINCLGINHLVERLDMNIGSQYNVNYKVTWNPESDSIPNKAWLQKLWDFLKEEFEKLAFNKNRYDDRHAQIKSLMGNWTVFPVKVKSGPQEECHYLMPFSSAELVIHSNVADSYIKEALAKMELPVVDDTIFEKEQFSYTRSISQNSIIDFITQFIATASTPERILTSLVSLLDENDKAFEVLDSENKKNILLFFVRFIGSSLNQQHSDDLRKLPCYLSIHETYITLNNKKKYFVLHAHIPKVEREKWVADSKAEFIKDDSSLKKLHTLLGLTKSTELDVYRQFILPSFCKFTHEARVEHLHRIQTLLSSLSVKQTRDSVISNMGLKTTPLISHKDKPIKRICEFFDDSVPLFSCMLEPEMFLPKPLCKYKWRDFMKELGLITKPTPMKILEFARAIEQGMVLNELDPQTEKSKVLIRHISNSDELMKNTSLIRDLSHISFLAPHPLHHDLVALHKPYKVHSDGRLGIKYKGALTYSNEHLVWTSANLLPEYAVPHIYGKQLQFNDLLPDLNASVTPSLDNVLVHIKNICTNLKDEYGQSRRSASRVKSVECRKLLNRVINNIYRFLCEKQEESNKIQKELKNEPIMLVDEDERLCKAEFTVKTIKAGLVLKPYIYQIPECFVQYMELFSYLGAQEKPSIWQCCELLTMIHADIKDDSFRDNPNLKRMVKFAVRKIFKSYLEKDWLCGRTTLYLPNRSCQLVKSNTLKYYDKPMFEVRLNEESTNVLINFKEIELKNDATVYIQKMPRGLQPCKFSKSVQEVMSSIPEENKCCFAKEGACGQLNFIRHQIHSAEFRHGIYRLMKHEAYQSGVELPETVLPNVPELTRDHLSIQCLKQLETHLVESDIIIEDSKMEEDCLLEETTDTEKTIFIRHQNSGDYGFLKLMLANIISKLTGEIISNVMAVEMLIFCDLKKIQTILSKHNIRELDANTSESMSLPDLGSQLPDYIVESLDNDPINEFTPGEYVVYELCEAGNEVYVYAMIVRRINSMYEIDFGRDNNKVVSAFDLYKWVPCKSNTDRNPDEEKALQAMVDISTNSNSEQSSKTHPKRASTPSLSENLEETKEKVSNNLEEIWKLGTEERKKAVRRLYLKWHPDKNPGREGFCSEVFKHLKNEIGRLEKGLPRKQKGEEPTGKYYNSEDDDRWEGYYKEWNRRARRDKRRREHYTRRDNFRSGGSFSWTDTDFSFTNPPPPRSMPFQAKLWQKQAREDLRAADNDIDGYPSYEWVAYKCIRAVEKSLKAAILSSKGMYEKEDNIRLLSMTVSDLPGCPDKIRMHVDELCAHGKDQNRAQYPGRYDDEIPHELFDRNCANKCISTAKIILDMMDDVIAFQ